MSKTVNKLKETDPPPCGQNRTTEQLAAELSDDFNNILTVILGACSLIDMGAADDRELNRSMTLIRTSAEHAIALTDRLAHMSGAPPKADIRNLYRHDQSVTANANRAVKHKKTGRVTKQGV